MPVEYATPAVGAALLLDWLEWHGAIVTLGSDEDFVRVDLDPIPEMTAQRAEFLAHAILGLRHELRTILLARRTMTH